MVELLSGFFGCFIVIVSQEEGSFLILITTIFFPHFLLALSLSLWLAVLREMEIDALIGRCYHNIVMAKAFVIV